MTAQHRLLPGNGWDVTVSGLLRRQDQAGGARLRAARTHSWTIRPELGQRLALRRIRKGGVSLYPPALFADAGRPIPEHLAPFFADLIDQGHARLGDAWPGTGQQHVQITPSGEALFVALDQARHAERGQRRPATKES